MSGRDSESDGGSSEDTEPVRGETVGATTAFDAAVLRAEITERVELCPAISVVAGAQVGMTLPAAEGPLVFGREPACDVVLSGRGISRRHFRIEPGAKGGEARIVDLDSTNGVFINGVLVRRRGLVPGDRIQIGPSTVLKFSLEDATEITIRGRKYEESIRDDLTGTHNRRYFESVLEHEIAYARRRREALSILLVDIDHFKQVNDHHGHQAGDYVLRRVARHLAGHLRAEDLFARYGGEEFAVLLRGQDGPGATETAERLRRLLAAQVFEVGGSELRVTASFGVATLDPDADQSPGTLVAEADRNLYAAKAGGRNRIAGTDAPD